MAGFSVFIQICDFVQQCEDKLDIDWFDSRLSEGNDNLVATQGEHGVAGTLLTLHESQAQEQRLDFIEADALGIVTHTIEQLPAFCR